jgi:hypothetical protein
MSHFPSSHPGLEHRASAVTLAGYHSLDPGPFHDLCHSFQAILLPFLSLLRVPDGFFLSFQMFPDIIILPFTTPLVV